MPEKGSKHLQYLAVSAANLNTIACGAVLGWTSPVLPKLQENNPVSPDNPLGRPITKEEGSWIGSLAPLGIMLGSLVSAYLAERAGRKRALLISAVPLILGWIVLGTATSIHQMYAGRLILGFGLAICFTTVPMYTGEIAEVSIRGTLGSFMQLFITIGFLLSYSIGPFASYTVFWLFCVSLYVIFFLCFAFMPESPYFLVSQGQHFMAAQALARLRSRSLDDVSKEIEEIQEEIVNASSHETSWREALRDRIDRKSVLIMVCMICFVELMGIDVVLFYAEDIFRNAGASNTAVSAIIVGLVQMLATLLTSVVVDRSGRKILLLVSSVGAGVTVGILGVYFYLQKLEYDLSEVTWIPLATLVVYILVYSLGWGPLPWVVMGEIFAPGVKSKASALCVLSINTLSFLLTKFFTNVEQTFGAHICFGFFAFCCALEIVFVMSVVPETKGKTLVEIQRKLGRRSEASRQGSEFRNEIFIGSQESRF
ncbi:facilitated trehalose transporter Tret1-like [Copidosoma floridanum]|uniref:facilitated trehalose transporter Tret1-like n=1 Tax=Copidosoma floridanum TaxID=29053 RepID=UPI0006C942E1|nr:facilitated trehalose transporter Tret1-like [Copidosoma floridanum]